MTQTVHFAKAIGFAWVIAFGKWPIFKMVSFLEYLLVFVAFFCTEQCSCTIVFRMFLAFLNFDLNWPFCKGYSLCQDKSLKITDFQNGLISRIFVSFGAVSCALPDQPYCSCRMVFRLFLELSSFDRNWPFCKGYIALWWAIVFARLPIFKMVSFREYLVSFGAVFCTETLYCSCRIVFRMFLAF